MLKFFSYTLFDDISGGLSGLDDSVGIGRLSLILSEASNVGSGAKNAAESILINSASLVN